MTTPFSIYEAIMLLCFGAAWPFSIARSWRSRTSKGKSIFFLFVVEVGYAAGIMNKITLGQCHDPVLGLYILNILMVAADTALYFRNRRLDRREELGVQKRNSLFRGFHNF